MPWLVKSEPEAFSLDDLRRKRTAPWDGVRNYQARNNLRAMRLGDRCIFYHSNAKPPGAAGVCEVVREHYPDHTAWDPSNEHFDPGDGPTVGRWSMVDMRFVGAFARFLPLDLLCEDRELQGMVLFSRGRLSVQPVSAAHFARICELGGLPTTRPARGGAAGRAGAGAAGSGSRAFSGGCPPPDRASGAPP